MTSRATIPDNPRDLLDAGAAAFRQRHPQPTSADPLAPPVTTALAVGASAYNARKFGGGDQ